MKSLKAVGPVAGCCAALLVVAGAVMHPSDAKAATKLDTVLSQMDAASKTFKSAEASFHKDLYDHTVKETSLQDGSLYVIRTGGATQIGIRLLDEKGEISNIVEYKNQTVRKFVPKEKCFESYSMAKQSSVESFLSLGFGGSGADLKKTWDIKDDGTEQMTDGGKQISVEKLELVGKDASVRQNFSKVILWIDPARGVSLKQEFDQASGDRQTAIYSNIRVNQKVNTDPYKITGNVCK